MHIVVSVEVATVCEVFDVDELKRAGIARRRHTEQVEVVGRTRCCCCGERKNLDLNVAESRDFCGVVELFDQQLPIAHLAAE